MLMTADHLGGCLGPLVSLATAAEATQSLRVGTLVLNNDFYNPSVLAREAATLDLLSDGRLELGLGAGHAQPEYERAGLDFDPAAKRVERLSEAVPLLRRLLDGEVVSFTGAHYRLSEERCDPNPVQAHIPLLVGGAGHRVHALAARWADTVGFTGLGRVGSDGQHAEPTGFPTNAVDAAVAHVREEAGRRMGALELQVLVQAVLVTTDPMSVAADLSNGRLRRLSETEILETPYLDIGSQDEIIDKLLAERERWGFSHYTFRVDALAAIEPVVRRLAGT
jgi:probable F420-dependent oxidoreductase